MKVVFKEDIKGYSNKVLRFFKKGEIIHRDSIESSLFNPWLERGVCTMVEEVKLKTKPKTKPKNKAVEESSLEVK